MGSLIQASDTLACEETERMSDEALQQLDKVDTPKRGTLPEVALLCFILANFTFHDDLPLWGLILLMFCTITTWLWMVSNRHKRERVLLRENANRAIVGKTDSDSR